MKNLILLAALCCLFCACKKDSSTKNQPYAHSMIVGKWYVVVDSLLNYTNNKLTRVVSVDAYSKNEAFFDQYDADGSVTVDRGFTSAQKGVFVLTGTNISITTPPYNYSTPSGSFTIAGISETGEVKSLSANSLLIHFDTYEYISGDTIRVTHVVHYGK